MKSFRFFGSVLILALHCHTGVNALFCYRCISLDCESGMECENIENFLKSELRTYYHPEDDLYRCPGMDKNITWRYFQMDTEPCPEEPKTEGTCTVGRMQIKTGPKVYYGTVLGCAKNRLLKRIERAHKSTRKCDYVKHGSTDKGGIQMELEHCRHISTKCYDEDFCVDRTQSKVKPWPKEKDAQSGASLWEDQPEETKFWAFVCLGGIVLLVVVLGLGMAWDTYRKSLNVKRDCEKPNDYKMQMCSEVTLSNNDNKMSSCVIGMTPFQPMASQNILFN